MLKDAVDIGEGLQNYLGTDICTCKGYEIVTRGVKDAKHCIYVNILLRRQILGSNRPVNMEYPQINSIALYIQRMQWSQTPTVFFG